MTNYESRPADGTSLNSAADSYTSGNTFDSFPWDLGKIDFKIESNAAVVSFKAAGESSFGDDMKLTTGHHSLSFEESENYVSEVRIKNATSGSTTDYQITGWAP